MRREEAAAAAAATAAAAGCRLRNQTRQPRLHHATLYDNARSKLVLVSSARCRHDDAAEVVDGSNGDLEDGRDV